jgi:hypothetical protein
VTAAAVIEAQTFDCQRTGPTTWERGALQRTDTLGLRAGLSASVVEECGVLQLLGITNLTDDRPGLASRDGARSRAAQALLLEVVNLYLEERPLCPDLPPELAPLDLRLERGTPREIGEAGLGVELAGSIDVSTTTVLDILGLLQKRGALPPPR